MEDRIAWSSRSGVVTYWDRIKLIFILLFSKKDFMVFHREIAGAGIYNDNTYYLEIDKEIFLKIGGW